MRSRSVVLGARSLTHKIFRELSSTHNTLLKGLFDLKKSKNSKNSRVLAFHK